MSLKSGVFWSAIDRFSVQGLQFLLTIVITRFVSPEDYGLVAMLGIFLAISNSIIDNGFSNALIQKQKRTEKDFSVVFYYNVFVAICIYIILYNSSSLIASFYNEPRLDLLTKIVCLSLLFSSLNVVPIAKLMISMDFKTITKVSLISAGSSGFLGVVLAFYGYGVWAIVAQSLMQYIMNTLLLWYSVKWIPKWDFSYKSFKDLYGFGSKLMISGLLHTIYLNLYTLVIGKFLNAYSVGLFNRANSLAQYPSTNIVNIVNRVYFPALCKLQDNPKSFAETFHSYLRMSCYIVFPLSAILAALADPLVRLLLTDKWAGAIIPLQIISIAYMIYPIMLINNQPLQALNHTNMFLIAEIIKKTFAVLVLILSINYGLFYLCLSILLYNIIDSLIILLFTRRIMPTGFRRQFKELAPIFVASIITGGVVFSLISLSQMNSLLLILWGGILGVITFTTLSAILKIKEFYTLIKLLK